ncbi:hypothetical protein SAMN04488096_11111 [Mesonia phycicola]|uniref:Uncharacterized protein n=1 Tax=Mesonia phycicola TaxID=579105 RepID=A0A1M6HG20_9FLAO|nr:hypothetical protein [Mesonia phycicola]SHJ21049.1 hypothetical protein SAMN04488096_11111 [Mesonia phycicola]
MKKLYFLMFFLFSLSTIAQSKKKEKEEHIRRSEMPENAIFLLESFKEKPFKRMSYFFETDGFKKSYEAKFKFNKKSYSIEFTKEGKLEDVEVIIKQNKVEKAVLNKIKTYLNTSFDAFKIEKIQQQYSNNGNEEEVIKKSLQQNTSPDYYEIVAQTRLNKKYQKFEFLFDAFGNLKVKREVATDNYDYLIF